MTPRRVSCCNAAIGLLVKTTFTRIKASDKKFQSLQNLRLNYAQLKKRQEELVTKKAHAIEKGT